jgi:hypothetical protein
LEPSTWQITCLDRAIQNGRRIVLYEDEILFLELTVT